MGICNSEPIEPADCEDCLKNGIIHTTLKRQGLFKQAGLPNKWNKGSKTIRCYEIIQKGEVEKFKKLYIDGNLVVINQFDYNCPSTALIYRIYRYDMCKIEFDNIEFNVHSEAHYLE